MSSTAPNTRPPRPRGGAADPETILRGLNPEQRKVATSFGAPVVVLAGAGTGKTRAITHRIAYGVATGQQRATSTLAVTFTQRAAGEMRSRLSDLGVPNVQARTFHSAALRQLRYFWPRVHGRELPEVTSKKLGMVAEAARAQGLGEDVAQLRDLAAEISWAKVSNVTVERYAQTAEKRGRAVAGASAEQVARVFAGYEQVKRRREVIDFDDILLCTVAMLHESREVAEQIRDQYRHFTVDEYQDVSPLQQALLELWISGRPDVCIVGDPQQSIHGFAGARSAYLLNFERNHPGASVLRLDRNYRSTPQVLAAANALMAAQKNAVALVPQREAGPAISVAVAADDGAEAAGVAQWLVEIHREGVDWSQMAILFRINAQSPALEAALTDAEIPYQVRDAEGFYQRPEIRRALGQLTKAAELDPGAEAIAAVTGILTGLGWSAEAPQGAGSVRTQWESLNALSDLAEQLVDDDPELDLSGVVAEMLERAARQQVPTANGVTLSTMHSAKGLEWEAVAVIGVREGMMPFSLAKTGAEIAEEHRLLYVALTRAKTHLRISWASGGRGNAVGRRSRFLARLDGIVEMPAESAASVTKQPQARRGKRPATCYVCGGALTGAQIALGRHDDCPATMDEELFERLKEWRLQQAKEQSAPAFVIFTDRTLRAIAERKPANAGELTKISGIGAAKAERYGEAVLNLVRG